MKTMLGVVLAAGLALLFFSRMLKKESGAKGVLEQPKRKPLLLSEREQAMHNRLVQALPDLVVLAQVSLGALLAARSRAVRNTFDRKTADFVVCDKAFEVLAVIELDDASHKAKAGKDAARDALLMQAGYRVLRYSNVPDIEHVRRDFAPRPLGQSTSSVAPIGPVRPRLD